MSDLVRINPFDFFVDLDGDALDGGYIYIGQPNLDPRQYPNTVFYNEDLTIPASQPLRTSNGYVVRNGSPAFVYISGNYSILVQDSRHRQIYYVPELNAAQNDITVDTIGELRTLDPSLHNSAEVLKYSASAPWYVGKYLFDPLDATTPDNGGTVIVGVNGSRWKLVSPLLISPEIFGAVGDGSTDDSEPMGRFIDALLENKTATARPEARYKINSGITRTLTSSQSLRWDMNGATFVQGGNNTIMSILNGADGSISGVSSVVEVAYNLGDGAVNTIVMQITGGAHPFTEPGQIGKIFSDDLVPDNDASNQFCSEYFVVGAIESSTVFYTTGVFDEVYTNGIRIVRPSTAQVQVNNLSGESVWQDSVSAGMFVFGGFLSPKFSNLRCMNANATFFSLTGNCRAEVNIAVGRRLKNRPDLSAFGYFINDSAAWGSTIRGIDCVYARHAYTTTTPSTVPGDDKWWLRGRTIGSEVIDGRGQGCANAFDTHSPALRVRFVNCISVDDFRGNNTGGAGIQIRGNDCEVINCDVSESKIGVAQSGASKTTSCTLKITGLKYRGPRAHTPVSINGNSTFSTFVEFDQGDISTIAQNAFDVTNGLIIIRDTNVTLTPTDVSSAAVILRDGGNVRWFGGSYNVRASTTGAIIRHSADATTSYVEDLRVSGVTGQLSYFASSNAAYSIESRFRRMQLDADVPGATFLGYEASSPKVSTEYMVGYNTRPIGYVALVYGSTGNKTIDLNFAGDATIYRRLECTAAGVNISAITQGAFPGQLLVLNNRNTSTQNVTVIDNTAGGIAMVASAVLTPGRGMTLVWDGTLWRSAIIQ